MVLEVVEVAQLTQRKPEQRPLLVSVTNNVSIMVALVLVWRVASVLCLVPCTSIASDIGHVIA